jgi:adenosine deaminase
VGFDLAGSERGNPAGSHRKAFAHAHENFLHKTVHAGEAYGPESIFQAITMLHADRIGHGLHLFDSDMIENPDIEDRERYVERLANSIAENRTTVEVCLTSNLQTSPDINDIRDHSLSRMLEHGLSVTLCTDNRLVSNTTVTDEIQLAVDSFDISEEQLRNIVIHGFKRSFYYGSYSEKRRYVREIIDYYDATRQDFLRKRR